MGHEERNLQIRFGKGGNFPGNDLPVPYQGQAGLIFQDYTGCPNKAQLFAAYVLNFGFQIAVRFAHQKNPKSQNRSEYPSDTKYVSNGLDLRQSEWLSSILHQGIRHHGAQKFYLNAHFVMIV